MLSLAHEEVKVALSGDGGDELFAGYRRQDFHMKENILRSKIPYGFRRIFFGLLGKIYPKLDFMPKFFRAKSTFEALAMKSGEAYCHTVSRTPERELSRLRSDKFNQQLGGYRTAELFNELYEKANAQDELSRIQYIDFKTFLSSVLTKVDRTSMAKSLEVRVPILDHEFVDWATKIPWQERIKNGHGKAVFKKALESILPKDILYREKKGFSVPMSDWLKDTLKERVMSLHKSTILMGTGLFKSDAIHEMGQEHLSGQRDHHATLWGLIMLEESLTHLQSVKKSG